MDEKDKLNPIESALESIEGSHPEASKELFLGTKEDIHFKTDVVEPENLCITKLQFADRILKEHGLYPIYTDIINDLLFINVSLDRKSRGEFVDVNSRKMSNIQMPGEFDKIEESRK